MGGPVRWAVPAAEGRWPTLAALIGVYALSVTPFVSSLLRGQSDHLGRSVASACATALLLCLVWLGHTWAWRLTVAFCMAAGLLVFVGGMLSGAWVVSGAGIAYLLLGTALVGTPAVRAFLDERWAARHAARRRSAPR